MIGPNRPVDYILFYILYRFLRAVNPRRAIAQAV